MRLSLFGSIERAIRLEHLHVVRPFKRGGFGAVLLAHCADHLHHALVFMLVQPCDDFIQHLRYPAHSVLQ